MPVSKYQQGLVLGKLALAKVAPNAYLMPPPRPAAKPAELVRAEGTCHVGTASVLLNAPATTRARLRDLLDGIFAGFGDPISSHARIDVIGAFVVVAFDQIPIVTSQSCMPWNLVLETSPTATRAALYDGLVESTFMDLTIATARGTPHEVLVFLERAAKGQLGVPLPRFIVGILLHGVGGEMAITLWTCNV